MMNVDLENVLAAIIEKLNGSEIQLLGEVVMPVVAVKNPAVATVANIGNTFLQKFDEYKLHNLLVGLSKDINMEQQINELYQYVCSSQTRAFQVGNVFKKALASESPKACVMLGILLAKHMGNGKDFSRDELIVCKAIENANDYDLDIFYELMKSCVVEQEDGRKKICYDQQSSGELIIEYDLTCSWGVYNRLFSEASTEWELEDETLKFIPTHYYVEKPANTLLELIKEVKQIWNYGK